MAARIAAGAAGGAIAVALMELLSARAAYPLMVVPFATSIVLVMGTPDAQPAQPRALIGGHIVSTLVGPVVLNVAGPETWAAAFAVGLAMAAMHATRTFHPPAGIDPLVVVTNNMPWTSCSRRSPSAPLSSPCSRSPGTTWCAACRGPHAANERRYDAAASIARSRM